VESRVVLIVDDSEDNRFLYQTILTYAGYTVLEARHGAEGVELAREYRGAPTRAKACSLP
jgi:CheY-like chemotaxis protein